MRTENAYRTVIQLPHGDPEVLRALGYPVGDDGCIRLHTAMGTLVIDLKDPVIQHSTPLTEDEVRSLERLEKPDTVKALVHLAQYMVRLWTEMGAHLEGLEQRLEKCEEYLQAIRQKGGM